MADGWVKLHRKLQESPMYKSLNSKQRDVLIQCLICANHVDNQWEWCGDIHVCGAGQFVTSLDSLASKCAKDVKVQSVRTALLKLEKWGFLTNHSTKTGRMITIVNWNTYQSKDEGTNKAPNKQPTKHQQRANKELTTNKNDKNVKNDKNNNIKVPENLNIPDFLELWGIWKSHRKEIRKPLTTRSEQMQLNKMSQVGVELAKKTIELSIENGWQGLFSDKITENSRLDTKSEKIRKAMEYV